VREVKPQNGCRDRQGAALVETETLSVSLPEIERHPVTVSAEQDATAAIRESETPGPKA
jgi:hypothetical protein